MARSVINAYSSADISINIVWISMLPGDSEEAAREISGMFTDPRVEQFWDAKRLSGIAYSTAVFPRWLKDGAESIPPGHLLHEVLRKRAEAPPQRVDAGLRHGLPQPRGHG